VSQHKSPFSSFDILLTVHLSIFIVLLTVHLSIFIVLLTVHLSIFISVFNQLDAQNLFHSKFYFMPVHVSSTCAHHQEVKIALHSLWYHHTYRCLEEHSGSVYTGHHDGCSRSRPIHLCLPFRLHGPITEKTTISKFNVIHFSYIVSLCYKGMLHTHQAIKNPFILHYTFV